MQIYKSDECHLQGVFFEGSGVRTTLMPSNAEAMNEVAGDGVVFAAKTQGAKQ